MKKNILLTGAAITLSALTVQAMPDGMPNFSPGSLNPAMSPGAFGAYEMQLMKDQRQRQYIDEDFKLYQKKKELEKSGEVDTDIINDERLKLQSDSEEGSTFIKRVKNRSKSNPKYIKQDGKVIIREDGSPEAKEIKVKNQQLQSEDAAVEEKDLNQQNAPAETENIVKPESNNPSTEDNSPKLREDDSLSSGQNTPVVYPAARQAKAKPWLDEITPGVPTIQSSPEDGNFDLD